MQALEERGIGRPSTYASIIQTIQDRGYVWKKGQALVPTWTAFAVVGLLEQHFEDLVDYDLTAKMDADLDAIANGEQQKDQWLQRFYFGDDDADLIGLKQLVEENLDEIDAAEINTFPLGADDDGNVIEGNGVSGNLCIAQAWPGQARTVYGDHDRFHETYFTRFPGLYFTGDGCRRDEDGYYWITGRVDDVINVSGHRMGTAEVESALVAHEAVAEAAVGAYGRLDVWVNNAGLMPLSPVALGRTEEWNRMVDVNLKGVFLGCKFGIPALLRAGGGSIVNTASFVAVLRVLTAQIAALADQIGAQLAVHLEEAAHLVHDLVEVAGLVARVRGVRVAVHGVAAPDHPAAGLLRRRDQRRQAVGLPIVVGLRLGCLSHARLTLEAVERRLEGAERVVGVDDELVPAGDGCGALDVGNDRIVGSESGLLDDRHLRPCQ